MSKQGMIDVARGLLSLFILGSLAYATVIWLSPTPQQAAEITHREAEALHKTDTEMCQQFMKKHHLTLTIEQCIAYMDAEMDDEAERENSCEVVDALGNLSCP